MKRQSVHACVMLVATFLVGCGSSEYVLKPAGDLIMLTTTKDVQFTGELLAVRESTIIISSNYDPYRMRRTPMPEVVAIETIDLKKIEVEGYSDRSWGKYVLIFEGVPTLFFTIAAGEAQADVGSAFLAFSILTGLNYLAFELSTPSPPGVEQPLSAEKLSDLRKYARFPQDFTPSQLDSLLTIYEIEQIK
jgi:hypothetical protein